MAKRLPVELRKYFAKLGKKGGKVGGKRRAEIYSTEQLAEWGRKGGRPPKAKKANGE